MGRRGESKNVKTYKRTSAEETTGVGTSADIGSGIQQSIDFLTAILLLSGQITTTGVFVVPDGIAFAATGNVFAAVRNHGRTAPLDLDLDVIDVVSALLLILGQIRVQGPYFAGEGLVIVFSGPIFGYKSVPSFRDPLTSKAKMFGQSFREHVLDVIDAREGT